MKFLYRFGFADPRMTRYYAEAALYLAGSDRFINLGGNRSRDIFLLLVNVSFSSFGVEIGDQLVQLVADISRIGTVFY